MDGLDRRTVSNIVFAFAEDLCAGENTARDARRSQGSIDHPSQASCPPQ